jgi:hypothetical protein
VIAKAPAKAAEVPAEVHMEDDDDVPAPDASMKTAGTAPPAKTDPKPINVGGADAMTKDNDVPAVPSCADSAAATGADPAAADGAMAGPQGEEPPVR